MNKNGTEPLTEITLLNICSGHRLNQKHAKKVLNKIKHVALIKVDCNPWSFKNDVPWPDSGKVAVSLKCGPQERKYLEVA